MAQLQNRRKRGRFSLATTVLVHIVSQRARVLRLRRIEAATRVNAAVVLPVSYTHLDVYKRQPT